jgi:hypothetical protein
MPDEVLISLKSSECIASIRYSANCKLNRRTLEICGTEGFITLDLLSDSAFISRLKDSKCKRAMGISFMESVLRLSGMLADRSGYFTRRFSGNTPHSRMIDAFYKYLAGAGAVPTPISEIDYVVRNCDRISREIKA